jgi:hypothetical protein
VPALTGYIDRARLVEIKNDARQFATGAQALIDEYWALGTRQVDSGNSDIIHVYSGGKEIFNYKVSAGTLTFAGSTGSWSSDYKQYIPPTDGQGYDKLYQYAEIPLKAPEAARQAPQRIFIDPSSGAITGYIFYLVSPPLYEPNFTNNTYSKYYAVTYNTDWPTAWTYNANSGQHIYYRYYENESAQYDLVG